MKTLLIAMCVLLPGCLVAAENQTRENAALARADAGAPSKAKPGLANSETDASATQPQYPDAGTPSSPQSVPTPEPEPEPTTPEPEPEPTPDAGVADSAPTPEPCTTYVEVPSAPFWTLYAVTVTTGPGESTTFQRRNFYCPSDGYTANACRVAFGNAVDGKVYPESGACRVAVPAACLPCTAGLTEI